MRDLFAKVLPHSSDVGEGIFNHVVKQPRGNRDGVKAHVGQDVGDLQRMDEVRFARRALLAAMLASGKEVGATQHAEIGLRVVLLDLFADFVDANHSYSALGLPASCGGWPFPI